MRVCDDERPQAALGASVGRAMARAQLLAAAQAFVSWVCCCLQSRLLAAAPSQSPRLTQSAPAAGP